MTTRKKVKLMTFKEVVKEKSIKVFIFYFLFAKTKEILWIIIALLIWYNLASNLRYTEEKGIEWIPSIKTNIEIKK